MAGFQYIDTHAHLNIAAFNEDREAVLASTKDTGVAVINVGTKESTSKLGVAIAEGNEHCYAIVGLHPIQTTPARHDEEEIGAGGTPFTSKGEVFDKDFYRELARHPKVVGIGECGFDYYHEGEEVREVQEAQFISQIELANELGLPLMIHTRNGSGARNAYDDVYEVLKRYAKVPANVHFYAGTLEQAKRFFELGCTISFTGVITFAKVYEEIIRHVPLELIHAETDCPYVAPVPHRGKRCEPQYVIEVYKKIAAIRDEDEEQVRIQLLENVAKRYRL